MLSAVRRSARSWAAALILFIALVAIVITGFGTGGSGGLGSLAPTKQDGKALATVGDRQLTEPELTDVINRQYTEAREQQPQLGMAEFVAQAFDGLLDQMVIGIAIQHFGTEQGLRVPDRMIDREIANIPAFQDAAGRFDDATFRRAIEAQGITEARLREDIAKSLLQRQLLSPIARGGVVPQGIVREYANLMLERRRGNIGVVPAELMRAGINPTPAEVATFYQRNRARFTIPERRIIRYAMIGPEQVAAAARATDQEIAAAYRQNQAAYGPRETRDLQQIVLRDQAAAQRFAQRVRGGASFALAAQEAGFGPADIAASNQNQAGFARTTTAPVAAAAFAAAQGAMVGPIRSELGFHFVRVERINTTPARPLASVRDEIARTIEQRKLAEALNTLITRIEERVQDGASLSEVAQAERLTLVTTAPVTAAGQAPGQPTAPPPLLQPILRAAFDIDPEEPETLIEQIEPNQRFALVGIGPVIAAAPPPLAQIQDQVRETLINQRALERASRVANQIAERINRGASPAQAFAQAGMPLPAPRQVNMARFEVNQAAGQVSPAQLVMFVLPQGRARAIPAPNGWFVVHHEQRTPGNAGGDATALREMGRNLTNDRAAETAEQFARAIERSIGVQRNDEAIRAMRNQLLSTAIE
jgi:peptidyl-prolyl cis-trans isomerase D